MISNQKIRCYITNAVPTAAGAIELAMSETPFTLHGSRCLVTGYGRIGKILSRMLCAIGARVSVEARKFSDLAMIAANGYDAIELNSLPDRVADFDIVFNTIPYMIFNREILGKLKPNALLIDLASRPGGVDFDAAAQMGIKVIWALSLPGKVAPVSAGTIIKETITNVIAEMKKG